MDSDCTTKLPFQLDNPFNNPFFNPFSYPPHPKHRKYFPYDYLHHPKRCFSFHYPYKNNIQTRKHRNHQFAPANSTTAATHPIPSSQIPATSTHPSTTTLDSLSFSSNHSITPHTQSPTTLIHPPISSPPASMMPKNLDSTPNPYTNTRVPGSPRFSSYIDNPRFKYIVDYHNDTIVSYNKKTISHQNCQPTSLVNPISKQKYNFTKRSKQLIGQNSFEKFSNKPVKIHFSNLPFSYREANLREIAQVGCV